MGGRGYKRASVGKKEKERDSWRLEGGKVVVGGPEQKGAAATVAVAVAAVVAEARECQRVTVIIIVVSSSVAVADGEAQVTAGRTYQPTSVLHSLPPIARLAFRTYTSTRPMFRHQFVP